MEKEYRYLIHLLGAYLRGEAPKGAESVDWDQLMHLAQIHSVSGILGYMSMKYPICLDLQKKSALRGLCLSTISVFAQRAALAQTMAEALEKAGIDHILMKGFLLRDLYPVPELRTFNDIDLVIRRSDRQRSDELMLSLGFQRHTDWEPVYSYVRGSELYEIHTDIMEIDVSDRADYKGYFQNMWDHARPVSTHSYRFTPEFHFLYLLTHIAKHVHGSGAGIRMYLDAAVFVQHYGQELNWTWLREQLKLLQLEDFAGTVLTAAEEWFGIPCPVAHGTPGKVGMDRFLDFTMEAGVFGHHNRDAAVADLKYADQAERASRVRHVLREIFPNVAAIRNRYTYLQEKPWLLPAAWVHRLVKNRDKVSLRVQQMHGILEADTEEVRQMQKLMREIGL